MLNHISPVFSPELLAAVYAMGHGDTIVLADGNFPSDGVSRRGAAEIIRADGHGGAKMLEAVLTVVPLDTYAKENFVLMQVVAGDNVRPTIWEDYKKIAAAKDSNVRAGFEERFAFYERAKKAYAIVATGEEAVYANIILKKGVIQ